MIPKRGTGSPVLGETDLPLRDTTKFLFAAGWTRQKHAVQGYRRWAWRKRRHAQDRHDAIHSLAWNVRAATAGLPEGPHQARQTFARRVS